MKTELTKETVDQVMKKFMKQVENKDHIHDYDFQ